MTPIHNPTQQPVPSDSPAILWQGKHGGGYLTLIHNSDEPKVSVPCPDPECKAEHINYAVHFEYHGPEFAIAGATYIPVDTTPDAAMEIMLSGILELYTQLATKKAIAEAAETKDDGKFTH